MRDGFYFSRKSANLPYPQFKHQEEAGYILIISSCLISFTLILLAAGYLGLQANQLLLLEREICSTRAFYIAQAGLKKIARDPDALLKDLSQEPWQGSFGEDETYQGKKVPGSNPARVIVTGACRTEGGHIVRRTLEAALSSAGGGGLPFTLPAVYVESEPSFSAIPGEIIGKYLEAEKKYSLAIQSAGKIKTELFDTIPIDFRDEYLSFVNLGCQKGVNCKPEDNYYKTIERALGEEGNALKLLLNTSTNARLTQPPLVKEKNPDYDWYYRDAARNIEYRGMTGSGKGIGARSEIVVHRDYNLPEGTYYLTWLELKPNARLRGEGKVKIFCVGDVLLGANSQIGDSNHIGNFSLLSYSSGGYNPVITLQEQSSVFGSILAPGCSLIVYAGVNIRGGIIVWSMRNFNLEGSSSRPWRISYDQAFEDAVSGFNKPSGNFLLANWRELKDPNQYLPSP